jgi:hypothetical protein
MPGTTWYRDVDGDAHGDPLVAVQVCGQPVGYVSAGDDCDDTDAAVFPGAPEICDGKDNNCDGGHDDETFVYGRYGGNFFQLAAAYDVASDGAGNVFVGGAGYVAKLDAGGHMLWRITPGATFRGVAVDGAGNVIVVGWFSGTVNLGIGQLTATFQDVLVAKLDPSGNTLWNRRFAGPGSEIGNGIAVDAAGNVLVTGTFQSTIDGGGGPLQGAGSFDAFVVKLDAAGNHLWSRTIEGSGFDDGNGISVDGAGNAFVTGATHFAPSTASNPFLLKLDPAGNQIWNRQLATSTMSGRGVTVAPDGDVLVVASSAITTLVSRLDGTGAPLWSQTFAGAQGNDIAVDALDNVFFAGQLTGPTDFGGGSLSSNGSTDAFVTKLGPTGAYEWARSMGSAGFDTSNGVAPDGKGNVLLVGSAGGTINLGGGPMSGFNQGFLAKYGDSVCAP